MSRSRERDCGYYKSEGKREKRKIDGQNGDVIYNFFLLNHDSRRFLSSSLIQNEYNFPLFVVRKKYLDFLSSFLFF